MLHGFRYRRVPSSVSITRHALRMRPVTKARQATRLPYDLGAIDVCCVSILSFNYS